MRGCNAPDIYSLHPWGCVRLGLQWALTFGPDTSLVVCESPGLMGMQGGRRIHRGRVS